MFNMNSSFNNPPKPADKTEREIGGDKNVEQKEKVENSFWFKIRTGFAKYIGKPLFEGYGKLEYPKPLSILLNHKAEIARNKEASKMLSPEQRGPTKEQIYASAIELAKKLGWKEKIPTENVEKEMSPIIQDSQETDVVEKTIPYSPETGIPVFITNRLRRDLRSFDITDEEIDKLKPAEAWDLLQQKTISQEIKEPKKEKNYSTVELENDFSILQEMWEEAYEKMDNVNDDKGTTEILDLTAKTFDDPKPLEEYLEKNASNLKPEERFFVEMSIWIKKFRTKTKDLIYDGVESKDITESVITKEEFANFVDTGKISESILNKIAQKIMSGGQMSREELSIYTVNSKAVENILNKEAVEVY